MATLSRRPCPSSRLLFHEPIMFLLSLYMAGLFGFGIVLVFLSSISYLIDTYTSSLPLSWPPNLPCVRYSVPSSFSSLPTYTKTLVSTGPPQSQLSLPLPVSPSPSSSTSKSIRLRCKYAAQSDAFIHKIMQQAIPESKSDEKTDKGEEPEKFNRTEVPAPEFLRRTLMLRNFLPRDRPAARPLLLRLGLTCCIRPCMRATLTILTPVNTRESFK